MTISKLKINWILLFLSGGLSLFFIVLFYGSLNDFWLDNLFNTDSLYLPSLYQDFFIDSGKVGSWVFNSSPNFVPDMLLYFPLNYLTGNFRLTTIVFSLVQQVILLMLLYNLFRRFFGKNEISYHILVFLLTVIFILPFFTANDYYLSFLFVSNTFHFGTFIMALASLNLAFWFMEKKSYPVLILLIIIQIIAFLSDRLFLVLFTGPAFLTFALTYKNRQSLVLAISQVGVALVGFILFNNLKGFFNIHLSLPHRISEISYFFDSLQMMMQQFVVYFSNANLVALILILTFVSFVFAAIIVIRNYRSVIFSAQPDKILIYLLFSVFFIPAVIMAPLLNGSYTNFDTIRYIVFAFYLAIFNIPVILWFFREKINTQIVQLSGIILFVGLLGFGIFLTTKTNLGQQISKMTNYYPALVERVDKVVVEEGLKFGLANYWDAKHITMFSKSGVKIYAVKDNLKAHYHVSNQDWFYGCSDCTIGEKEFNFILLNRFVDREAVNYFLNEEHKMIKNDNLEILITKPFVMSRKTNRPAMFK